MKSNDIWFALAAEALGVLLRWGADKLKDDVRWQYGMPPAGNANFAWLQHMIYHLSPAGKIGMVLANGSLSSQSGGEGDLVYMSDTDERYVNKKDDIEMKLCSGLTASDLRELGVSGGVMMNTPTAAGTGLPVTTIYDANQDVEAKAEQLYVDSYYKELHEARVELEQTLEEDGEGWSRWHHYRHPALGKEMVCLGMDRNLMGGTARLKLKDY